MNEFFSDVCPACGNGMPHGPAGCTRSLQKWQRESPEWCVMMLRDTAERLYADAENDCAAGKQHGTLDKYRKGALMQRRLNLLAAANAIEALMKGRQDQ